MSVTKTSIPQTKTNKLDYCMKLFPIVILMVVCSLFVSKVMGRHLVTFNCAEATNMSILSRLLSGMVQSGSWVMFNNLNCMTEGNLSIINIFCFHCTV